ncbi:hypothetical protein NPIL_363691, partial [Nephila pilipes]
MATFFVLMKTMNYPVSNVVIELLHVLTYGNSKIEEIPGRCCLRPVIDSKKT